MFSCAAQCLQKAQPGDFWPLFFANKARYNQRTSSSAAIAVAASLDPAGIGLGLLTALLGLSISGATGDSVVAAPPKAATDAEARSTAATPKGCLISAWAAVVHRCRLVSAERSLVLILLEQIILG